MAKENPAPLVVLDRSGNVQDVLACNAKSRAKTLEQNELWILRPDNGRVLPFRGGGVRCGGFVRRGEQYEWYQVRVEEDLAPAAEPTVAPTGVGGGAPDAAAVETAMTAAAGGAESPPETAPETDIPVLTHLADLIAERRRDLPEGSYTTHLFARGPSKIRKKTGEEAVELILAENRDEIVAEAADLLYHAMVLLESEGVRIEEVLQELARRHGESG
jgi:phosphoribosyl-ATP pyrophosphohydrolase